MVILVGMRPLLALALVVTVVGLLASLGAAQAPPASGAPVTASGTWVGVIAAPTGRVELTFQLEQTGERVRGTYDYRGPVMVALNVRVTGSLRGDALTLFEEGGAAAVLDARVAGASFIGVFRGSGPPGRLEAARIN